MVKEIGLVKGFAGLPTILSTLLGTVFPPQVFRVAL